MRVTLLLADSAAAVEGKLYILGGGWSVTGPGPTPFAIAMKFEVPWSEANRKHRWTLELLDADGKPVSLPVPGSDSDLPVKVEGDLEVGRPPGLREGTPLDFPLAINFGPMPLEPDSRYTWRLTINDDTHEDWVLAFSTRPAADAT